jgi:hypothetical protein
MGPHDSSPVAFAVFLNGEPVGMADGHLPEITIAPDDDAPAPGPSILNGPDFTFSMRMKPWKGQRCRTRKRFIKLLMAHGLTRNQAAEIAKIVPLYHRCGFPAGHRPTYQGLFLSIALLSIQNITITERID